MPLYSYQCKACDHAFEKLVRSSDVPTCPSCGAEDLEKLVSRPTAEGKSGAILKNARIAAAGQGHFSNYSRSELKRR